jgi:hypothetical protein
MFPRWWRLFLPVALWGAWPLFAAVIANGEETIAPQPSIAAIQANAGAVQNFTEFLKAEAERAEAVTKHESDVIENALKRESDAVEKTLNFFKLVVAAAGAILVAGAGYLAWVLVAANRASKIDIQQEVSRQLPSKVFEEIETRFKSALDRITTLENNVDEAEKSLDKQRNAITNLIIWTMGEWPYNHLKSIYDMKARNSPNEAFKFQSNDAFKRELGYLIDNGYICNINLDEFKDTEPILHKLTLTDTGRRYVEFRESLAPKPL